MITGKPNELVLYLMQMDREKVFDLSEHKDIRKGHLIATLISMCFATSSDKS